MKKYLHIFLYIALAFTAMSCNREDDIDDIFVGKTWYMVGGRFNGTTLNSEIKNFYTYGTSGYQINFQNGTFTGTLSPTVTFSGNWGADAKSRDLTLTITKGATTNITFDHNVYSIIKNISYYKGDDQVLTIYADKENFINLSNSRSPEVNN